MISCDSYFKKCRHDGFCICAIAPEKGWIGIEPEDYSFSLYHYVVRGSAKIGVPFKEGYQIVKPKQFFDFKDYLHESVMMEALEDFYMIGFSTMDKQQVWDGRLDTEETLNISSDSYVICFDGQPTINDQVFTRFDYAEVSSEKEYEISLNDGVLALFTKK